jgi:hypothetical protein
VNFWRFLALKNKSDIAKSGHTLADKVLQSKKHFLHIRPLKNWREKNGGKKVELDFAKYENKQCQNPETCVVGHDRKKTFTRQSLFLIFLQHVSPTNLT